LPSPVAPIPLRLRGKRLITVAELEHYLRNQADATPFRLKSTDFARQFDAEDGSDRSEWLHPSLALRASNRFAASDISSQFADARTRHCDVEYLLDWQGEVTVRGMIDHLWQDAEGGWHLLLFTSEKEVHRSSLLLAALAVQRRFQSWPKSATLFDVEGETVLTYSGNQRQEDQLLAAVGDALRAIAALSLPD